MFKVVPAGTDIPYTYSDLSVVIPHVKHNVNRIKWFIPQYVMATPPEIVANTYIVTDKDDQEKYDLKTVLCDQGWSTNKIMLGYQTVQTRLCARVHNDTAFLRADWARVLIDQLNKTAYPQMIGELHATGDLTINDLDGYFGNHPYYQSLRKEMDITIKQNNLMIVGIEYLHAYFIVSQTYVLRALQTLLMDWDNNRRGKEDCMLTFLATLNRVPITWWQNQHKYVSHGASMRGDFKEEKPIIQLETTERLPVFEEQYESLPVR